MDNRFAEVAVHRCNALGLAARGPAYALTALCAVTLGIAVSFSAQAGANILTCDGLFDCAQLKQACHKGSFGAVIYPDGHVWGVCVI